MVERCWAIKRADLRKKAGCIPPEPTSNKVWLFQNSGKFQKDLADDQSNLEETLILPVFFHAAAPKLWNDLPGSIRNTQSLNKFKKAIKTFLFAKAF